MRLTLFLLGLPLGAAGLYTPVELTFTGPPQTLASAPARDIEFWVRIRHSSGFPDYRIHGFHDGGDTFRVRFTPDKTGAWTILEVHSNEARLKGQRQGETIQVDHSERHGFWIPEDLSRWYRRSDGSHQYIIGNTQYSFLSGMRDTGPSNAGIAAGVRANARYFKKLRFGLHGDRYPHPVEKPYLDGQGNPSDNGDFGHRPNPRWFQTRVDLAVRTAFEEDLIADLILCGPDVEDARANLRARGNGGGPAPFLRYIAARYGAYPNVWICLCNEYDIRLPRWTPEQVAGLGSLLRSFLPYPTPLSVHPSSRPLWAPEFDLGLKWFDHAIIQRKIRHLPLSADTISHVHNNPGQARRRLPVINDELSYEGEGDQHTALDTVEAMTGAFLGGGYASTGFKTGNKLGHYFWGGFTPAEHTAAPSLQFLRETIDSRIEFWRMAPEAVLFSNLDPDFRALAAPGRQLVLGTNRERRDVAVELPPGLWTADLYDIAARTHRRISSSASGRYSFHTPNSRAALFVFTVNR